MNKKSSKKYSTIKKGKSGNSELVLIILVAAVVVIIGIAVTIFIATQTADNVVGSSNYKLSCGVSSHNIVVDIEDNEKSDDIEYITIAIDGYNIPEHMALKPVTDRTYPRHVVYESMGFGIDGVKKVSIQATFKDGSKKVIWMDSVNFG